MKLKDEQKKWMPDERFSIVDYKISADLLKNYSQMRLVALGGSITLIAAIIALPDSSNYFKILITNILLILAIYISIRVIGSINANVYARCLHLEWVEKIEKEMGFFTYWNKFVLEKSTSASSNAFLLTCIGFNVGGFLSSIISIFKSLVSIKVITLINDIPLVSISIPNDLSVLQTAISLTYILISLYILILNHRYIQSDMVTLNLIPRLEKELQEARDSIIPSLPIEKATEERDQVEKTQVQSTACLESDEVENITQSEKDS